MRFSHEISQVLAAPLIMGATDMATQPMIRPETPARPAVTAPPAESKPEPQPEPDPAPRPRPVSVRTVLLGGLGAALITLGGIGAGGVLVRDPLLADTGFSWLRYGHGKDLATLTLYAGLALLVLAWVRLGRDVWAGRSSARGVLLAIGVWTLPLLVAPPLFSRDIYSYLAQGALAWQGYDPYVAGPIQLATGPLLENVSWLWQNTPAPYGPLFILIAKGVVALTGNSMILGVVLMRLALTGGLVLLCWALPKLAVRLGGKAPLALWLAAANPLILVHLVGGAHNDLLMVGLLAAGVVFALDRRFVLGIGLVTLAVAVKASAVFALPFLVWMWAARMDGSLRVRLGKAVAAGLAVFTATFALSTLFAGVGLGWLSSLSNSSAVINWLSLPTAAGQLVHGLVSVFFTVDGGWFLGVARTTGWILLFAFGLRQWWLARAGGVSAVHRATLVLLAAALLSPTTFPWYFSWGLALAAGFVWSGRAVVAAVAASVWLLLVTYPTGDSALYDWGYLAGAFGVSALAALSMVRPDPLRLRSRA
ncbi:polyprenol phosphomannose-dependent alpha 1,6 mannosyltransferase MptB [Crossiella cryophila]|uniref:Alpha-1,6-mannosyltransferase n=1 Tax=Crossiella cryophila TaxID=43355 RepID=A0A7W7C904_9PSEU|nr:polyprenol phosphomannose-dependent alpha 1,6 mannosyltransferase MptB [Crossiella cryophila]MBB4676710.1 alpha-1,6-mannosyltransferase [Crossiella cryophila]